MNKTAAHRLSLVSTAVLLACQGAAWAQDTTLAPVKVRATAEVAPDKGVVAEDLERRQARDVRDALQDVPGVEVGGGGSPVAQKIYVRGVEDTMLRITLDGAPQGGNIFHHQGRFQFDPWLVKSIEVEKGTAGASAGPGALGGAMRVATKDATDLLRDGQRVGARIGAGYYTNDGWKAQLAGFGRIGTQVDALVAASRLDIGEYEDGQGRRQATSGTEQDSLLAKFNWTPIEGHKLRFSHNTFEESGNRYLRANMVGYPPGNNTLFPSTLERDTTSIGYGIAPSGGLPGVDLSAYRDDVRNRRTNQAAGRTFGEQAESSGVDLALTGKLGRHSWKAGFNHQKQESRALNPANVRNPAYSNGATNTAEERASVNGVYVEGVLQWTDALRVMPGLRYDRYSYTDNHDQTFEANGVSPSLRASAALTDRFTLRAGYTEALRGAGLKEAYLLDNGPGPRIYLNRADLQPEKARNLEAGFDFDGGHWTLQATVFRQTIRNYITGNVFGADAIRFNGGTLVSEGVELGGTASFDALQIAAAVSHVRPRLNGRILNDGDFGLGTTTGRSWRLRADYALPGGRLIDIGWAMRAVESLTYVETGTTGPQYKKPGYAVHDLHASWQPLGRDRLRLSLSVHNVFDKAYYDQSTYGYGSAQGMILGFAEPGRDVRLEASWQF